MQIGMINLEQCLLDFNASIIFFFLLHFSRRDELLNTVYSQSEFSLDEGERLLRGMQELREELNAYGTVVQQLSERAADVVPLKQRRQPVNRPLTIHAVCAYKQNNVNFHSPHYEVLCLLTDV